MAGRWWRVCGPPLVRGRAHGGGAGVGDRFGRSGVVGAGGVGGRGGGRLAAVRAAAGASAGREPVGAATLGSAAEWAHRWCEGACRRLSGSSRGRPAVGSAAPPRTSAVAGATPAASLDGPARSASMAEAATPGPIRNGDLMAYDVHGRCDHAWLVARRRPVGGRPGIDRVHSGRITTGASSAQPVKHEGTQVDGYVARLVPPWFNVTVPIRGEGGTLVASMWTLGRRKLRRTLQEARFEVVDHVTWFDRGFHRREMNSDR